jgi:hypothetical protein
MKQHERKRREKQRAIKKLNKKRRKQRAIKNLIKKGEKTIKY